jgi:hypothetical protein
MSDIWISYLENESHVHCRFRISINLSMVLQPFIGPWPLFQFLNLLHNRSQGCYLHTGQHKQRINAHKHPCLKWDTTPRSQRLSGRRQFMPQTAWPLGSALEYLPSIKHLTRTKNWFICNNYLIQTVKTGA